MSRSALHILALIVPMAGAQTRAPSQAPSSAPAAPPNKQVHIDLSKSEIEVLSCLVKKDAASCNVLFEHSLNKSDGREFAEVGCYDAGSPGSCKLLRDSFAPADFQTAEQNFRKACARGSSGGCFNMMQLRRAQAEVVPANRLPALAQDSKQLMLRVCADATARDLCSEARTLSEQMNRRNDPSMKPCSLVYKVFREGGGFSAGTSQDKSQLTNLVKERECRDNCERWATAVPARGASETVLRGQCVFGGRVLGASLWRPRRMSVCPKSTTFSFNDRNFFSQCYCERLYIDKVARMADKFGIYPVGEATSQKKMGTNTWYRCALSFHFDETSVAARSVQACEQNVRTLKSSLSGSRSSNYDLNFGSLNCAARPASVAK